MACEAPIDEPLISIYPNPSENGNFNIAINAYDEEEPMFVETFDLGMAKLARLDDSPFESAWLHHTAAKAFAVNGEIDRARERP